MQISKVHLFVGDNYIYIYIYIYIYFVFASYIINYVEKALPLKYENVFGSKYVPLRLCSVRYLLHTFIIYYIKVGKILFPN